MQRKTPQRDAITRVIREKARPLTPAEIHEYANKYYVGIGLKTVYRHLKELCESNVLIRIDYPQQPLRYEVLDEKGSRPHFICKRCNRLFYLPVHEPKVHYPAVDDYQIDGHEVVFYGACNSCPE